MNNRDYIISLMYKHYDTISESELDYRIFIMNRIIRLQPQPTNPNTGYRIGYSYIPNNVHCTILPTMWKRYQYFLLDEWKNGNHSDDVRSTLDSLISRTYKKIGKMYTKLNSRYEAISKFKQTLEA
jgi:hypothetical protein